MILSSKDLVWSALGVILFKELVNAVTDRAQLFIRGNCANAALGISDALTEYTLENPPAILKHSATVLDLEILLQRVFL